MQSERLSDMKLYVEMFLDVKLLHVVMKLKIIKKIMQAMLFFLLMRFTILLELELLERVRVLALTLATC